MGKTKSGKRKPSTPKIVFTPSANTMREAYIIIRPKFEQFSEALDADNKNSKLISAYLHSFMSFINQTISARTELNYHHKPIRKNTIYIPLHAYLNEDTQTSPAELIENRIAAIRDFWETFDWSTAGITPIWLARALHILKVDISSLFEIGTETPHFNYDVAATDLVINPPTYDIPHIKRITLNDGSTITVLVDSCVVNYGLYVNLSVPFDEMGMSYNALHLYEHMLTKAWTSLSAREVAEHYNGATFPAGLCYVYSIHVTYASLKLYLESVIKFFASTRGENGWEQYARDIRLEVQRTISETRTERSLTLMGRSDLHAYDCAYNLDIFRYWSNKPMDITIVVNSEDDIPSVVDTELLNGIVKNNPIRTVPRPPNVKYNYLPLDVIKMRQNNGFFTRKVEPEELKRKVSERSFDTHAFYGIDCVMTSTVGEDISRFNSVLYIIVFANKMFTDDELNEYLESHVIPFNCLMYPKATLQVHNGWEYVREAVEGSDM